MDKLRGAFNSMFLVLTPQNRWDFGACAKVFTLVEPKRLIAKCCGDKHSDDFLPGGRSVFAEMPIPNKDRGIFYFELEVGAKQREDDRCTLFFGLAPGQMPVNNCVGYHKRSYACARLQSRLRERQSRSLSLVRTGHQYSLQLKTSARAWPQPQKLQFRCILFFGLAPRQMPVNNCVGYHKGSYAYDNWGTFWGHPVEISEYGVSDTPSVVGMPEFDLGDVVGCGVNLATRQIIYTLNGERLDTANLFVDSATDLFPCLSSFTSVDKIEANFGPNFKFNIFNGI